MEEKLPRNRKIIEDLQPKDSVEKVDIRPAKKVFEQGGDPNEDVMSIQRVEGKVEINAITAMLLEKIDTFRLMADIEVEEFVKKGRTRVGMIDNLRLISKNFLIKELLNWGQEMKNKMHDVECQEEVSVKAYARLAHLLNRIRGRSPENHLKRGINTAMKMMWGVSEAIPVVFANKFKRPITPKEFEDISKNSRSLLYSLADSHLDLFVEIEKIFSIDLQLTSEDGVENLLYLRNDSNGMSLEINPRSLSPIQSPSVDTPRTGCPALYAIGPNRKNIIAEMHDWVIDLSKKYYLPALETLKSK